MPKRASVSRTAGSTVPRSSPTTTTWLRTLSSARMRTKSLGALPARRRPGWRRSRRESSTGGRGASRDRCAARRRGGSSCGWIRRTGGSRPRGGGRRWAAESPSPGPWARNRRAATPRGSRPRRRGGAPTGRSRSGRWPAPGRGRGRWKDGGRARAAGRGATGCRSATGETGRTSRAASVSCGRRRFRPSTGPDMPRAIAVQIHSFGIAPVQVLVERAIGGELLQQVAFALAGTPGTPRARAEPARHSRRNCANSSFRKRSLSAATRSYSTNGAARRASISAATAGDCRNCRRAPAARRNPPCLRRRGRGNSGRRCSSAGTGWC